MRKPSVLVTRPVGGCFCFCRLMTLGAMTTPMRRVACSFLETPREESYATVVVFQDIFGNRWDLLQPKLLAAS